MQRLQRSIPLFLGALLVVLYYWQKTDVEGFLEAAVNPIHNTLAACFVVLLIALSWRPKPFIRPLVLAVLAAVIINTISMPFHGMAVLFVGGALAQYFGANEVVAWAISVGALSSILAMIACIIFGSTRLVNDIHGRTFLYCGIFCFFSATPLLWEPEIALGLHKGLWITLLGLGLCFGVGPNEIRAHEITHAGSQVKG